MGVVDLDISMRNELLSHEKHVMLFQSYGKPEDLVQAEAYLMKAENFADGLSRMTETTSNGLYKDLRLSMIKRRQQLKVIGLLHLYNRGKNPPLTASEAQVMSRYVDLTTGQLTQMGSEMLYRDLPRLEPIVPRELAIRAEERIRIAGEVKRLADIELWARKEAAQKALDIERKLETEKDLDLHNIVRSLTDFDRKRNQMTEARDERYRLDPQEKIKDLKGAYWDELVDPDSISFRRLREIRNEIDELEGNRLPLKKKLKRWAFGDGDFG